MSGVNIMQAQFYFQLLTAKHNIFTLHSMKIIQAIIFVHKRKYYHTDNCNKHYLEWDLLTSFRDIAVSSSCKF